MKERRAYRMVARAERVEGTRRRILDAALGILFGSQAPLTLRSTAADAGVSIQTVLRQFGSQSELVEAAATEAWQRVIDLRGLAPPGDLAASVKFLIVYYESYGDRLVQARAREGVVAELAAGLNRARADHRRWVARTYRPQLGTQPEADRERILNALVAATDVYTWKLLRREMALDRNQAEATITFMVAALTS
jgi:AcrR family transcriptional regulator